MTPYLNATEQLVVEVFVRDIQRARQFYLQLGFELLLDKGDFVSLTWEGHHFFLDERKDLPPPPNQPQANIRIMVPDVDAHWRRVNEMGARIVASIANRDYGLRDFTIADPDGFGLRFATRLPG